MLEAAGGCWRPCAFTFSGLIGHARVSGLHTEEGTGRAGAALRLARTNGVLHIRRPPLPFGLLVMGTAWPSRPVPSRLCPSLI